MKITLPFLLCLLIPTMAHATQNPMFGKTDQNALTLYVGQGTGSGTLLKLIQPFLWEFEPMTFVMIQYSQPMTFFRMPARQNLHFAQNFGYNNDRGLSFSALGISWDVAFINWRGFYMGMGIGSYMRDSRDRYVESRLVFGEKVFIGMNLSDHWRAEFFTLHFSNGNFTPINNGFNFTGLAINYSF